MLDRSQFTGFAQGDQSFHMLFVIRAEQRESQPAQRLLDVNSRAAPAVNPEDRRGFWVGIRDSRSLPRFGIQNGDEGEARSACWDGRPHLLEVVYTGQQNFEMHVDGRRERRAMFNGTHFLGFQDTVSLALGQHFGQEPNAGSYYRGDIAEVLIYARPLSESERYAVGTSLSKKYSLRTHFRPLPQFERDVQPILATHCFNCHGRETQEAGLDLRTVSAMTAASNVITPPALTANVPVLILHPSKTSLVPVPRMFSMVSPVGSVLANQVCAFDASVGLPHPKISQEVMEARHVA